MTDQTGTQVQLYPFQIQELCAGPDMVDAYIPEENLHQTTINILQISSDGSLEFNEQPRTMVELQKVLQSMKANPFPYGIVLLRPDPETSCGTVQKIRELMADYLDCESQCAEGSEWDLVTKSHMADI